MYVKNSSFYTFLLTYVTKHCLVLSYIKFFVNRITYVTSYQILLRSTLFILLQKVALLHIFILQHPLSGYYR